MEETRDNSSTSSLDPIHIYNVVRISHYLDNQSLNDSNNQVFLCGKMFEHTLHAKYSFKACEFLVYIPLINKIFHSDMKSEDCFTQTLKWNYNFFKKIRLSLTADDNTSKSIYFCINYEKDKRNKEANRLDESSRHKEGNELDQEDELRDSLNSVDEEYIEVDKKIYFELHFLIDKQDITALRLQLNHIIDDHPYLLLMNRLLQYDKQEGMKLHEKQKCLDDKEKEISQMEKEILKQEENFRNRREDYMIKFHLLNGEKNKKLSELKFKLNKK